MNRTIGILMLTLALASLLGGCSVSHARIHTSAAVPLSATGAVHDPSGQLATHEGGYRIKQKVVGRRTQWRILWGVPLSKVDVDAYDVLCKNGGCPDREDPGNEAIVNVRGKLDAHWSIVLLWPGLIIPIIPTANTVRLDGTVVTFDEAPASNLPKPILD